MAAHQGTYSTTVSLVAALPLYAGREWLLLFYSNYRRPRSSRGARSTVDSFLTLNYIDHLLLPSLPPYHFNRLWAQ